MRRFRHRLTIAAAFAAIVGLGSTAHAVPTYEWRYAIDGGAFSASMPIATANGGSDSVVPITGLLINITTTSNNPGDPALANLFNATTDVQNMSGSDHTVTVEVTETDFTMPPGPGDLFAIVGPATVRQTLPSTTPVTAIFSDVRGFLDGGNVAYGTQFSTTAFSGSGTTVSTIPLIVSAGTIENSPSNPFTPGNPYSLTVRNTIELGANTSAHVEISNNFTPAAVPEPSTCALAGIGALGLIGYGLRRRKAQSA